MTKAMQMRLSRGWTRTYVTDKAGVHAATLRRLEDTGDLRADKLLAIANVYEVDPWDLLGYVPEPVEKAS